MTPALELKGLSKAFTLRQGWKTRDHFAVKGVDLILQKNEILGLVGESGSGKTTTGMLALRLIEPTGGQILIGGQDVTTLPPPALKPFRRRMQVIFQDSYSALNPMMTLEQIVAEPLVIHGQPDPAKARQWLDRVGLPASFATRYPHELSGGQRQRVAIARALILAPEILVADEPTSALDVSIKAQIINLLSDLQKEMGLSILFISHDLSVVRALTDRVAVMQAGRIVEEAPTETIFAAARHPYTQALLDAIPARHPRDRRRRTFPTPGLLHLTGADPSPEPRLIHLTPTHRVEAVITSGVAP